MSGSAGADRPVRVESRNGAPRLLVGGRPVRARMFFGGPGSSPIYVNPEGRQVSFEFEALADAKEAATMHFRFGQAPGDIWLDDIRVTDAQTGRDVMPVRDFEGGAGDLAAHWLVWPFGEQNTVGRASVEPGAGQGGSAGLHVRLDAPPDGRWPDFHLYHAPTLTLERGRTYRVSFWCRSTPARELTTAFYLPGTTFTHLGGPPGRFESQIKLAAGAGVDFVSFVIPTPWPGPGEKEDWAAVDAACDQVLRANPKALLLPRFGMEPPAWWAKAYPDDMMQWEDGSRQYNAVPASPRYRRDAAARTAALVAHLEAKYGDRMGGYHPCGQNTGEWFYQETWGGLLNGYAKADLEGWRAWLAQRYPDDAALQKAWGDPTAARATAATPSTKERRESPHGVLRDPASERKLVDFAEYQQHAMADLVCELARATRQASGGRRLVVFFYGYGFEFGSVVLGPATCGHYAMRRILQSPDIDVVCSPISYGDRNLGESGPVMSAVESVALAGKMWLQEDDTRTHESPDTPDAIARLKTPEETENVLARNVANEATRNMATWWMDLGMAGWFDDPRLWELMRRLAPLDRPFLEKPIPFRPEVAAVLDERAMLLVGPGVHEATFPMTYGARHKLGRMGAPYGQYLLDDVAQGRVRAKLYVFLNAWWLTAAQRRALATATKGATRVWCYAPGAYDDGGASPDAMRELTGFRLAPVKPERAWAVPTEAGRKRGLTQPFGLEKAVTPLYAATDATPEETLATYPDGSAAVAMRRTPGGVSLFVGAPGLTPELLRVAADAAGAHLYTRDDAVVHANGPMVSIHATKDGPMRLDLGRRAPVRDALTDRKVGDGPTLTLRLKRGDTRILRIGASAR